MSIKSKLRDGVLAVVSPESSYIDESKPLSPFSSIVAWLAIIWVVGFSIIISLFLAGCSSSGVVITLRDSSAIDVASISMEQSQWPVVSYIVGPTYYTWIRRDLPGSLTIDGHASLTNSTSALAIYSSSEAKDLQISATYTPTNAPTIH